MATKTAKPAPAAPILQRGERNRRNAARTANATLNSQNRRVLAQHYRAKYGVK